ncbi:MAG: dihydrolipoyl dehydrogenase, partial [Verrucomicrobia bacterium]|nr:dihydrolipoyl dehydrogenase [Verrucomicrobiota bacterium]
IPFGPRVMNSNVAIELPDVPKTLLVVGGGYIGLELGSVYATLGTKVSVVEMLPSLMPGADRDLVEPLQKRLKNRFQEILLSTRLARIEPKEDRVEVELAALDLKDNKRVYDKVLISVGRKPNTQDLGLEHTQVQLDPKGFVKVDVQRRTTEPNIFAVGDCAGEPMLAHKATHEARVAVETIAGKPAAFDPKVIPAVVFTDPEVAWCGLTETQALTQGRSVKVAKYPWIASGRATTLGRNEGLTKLIVDPRTERVLGVGIVGVSAGEMIAEGALAIEMGAVAADLKLTIHTHPTFAETLMEAAEAFYGHSTHLGQIRDRK